MVELKYNDLIKLKDWAEENKEALLEAAQAEFATDRFVWTVFEMLRLDGYDITKKLPEGVLDEYVDHLWKQLEENE